MPTATRKDFKDMEAAKVQVKPQVVAWAPFSQMVNNNPVAVKKTEGTKFRFDLSGGVASFNATGKTEHENSFEWEQTHWGTA
jgi:hypothetical protein